MGTVEPHTLVAAAERILLTAGATPSNAHIVAASLVESDLVGHYSHGVRRLVPYLAAIRDGQLHPDVEPTLDRARSAASVVDCRLGFGQVAARLAVREARRPGTNPIAWAAPRARGRPPVVTAFATAGIAEGKVAPPDRHRSPAPEEPR